MTTITQTAPMGARNRPQAGLWRRATQALGKLGTKMIALPAAAAARREAPSPEYFRFPPY